MLCKHCVLGMQNAECGVRDSSVSNATVCLCHVGAYENTDKTNCVQRVINDKLVIILVVHLSLINSGNVCFTLRLRFHFGGE